jgi:hypothetical protein
MAKTQAACPPPNSPAISAPYRMLAQKGAVPVTSHGQITGYFVLGGELRRFSDIDNGRGDVGRQSEKT